MTNSRRTYFVFTLWLLCQLLALPTVAGDVINVKLMTLELAQDLA